MCNGCGYGYLVIMYDVFRKCQDVRIVLEERETNRELVYIVSTVVRVVFREAQNGYMQVNIGVLGYVMRVLERRDNIDVFSISFSTLERESNLEKNGRRFR